MNKFEKTIKIGTKVKIAGIEELVKVKSVDSSRLFISVDGYAGSFQRGHVLRYTNK